MTVPATQKSMYLVGAQAVELREVAVPQPQAGELLVRVRAATTCGTDVKVYRRGGHPRMLRVPTPFGHEFAGTVAAAGAGAGWSEGDDVVVANSAPCDECRFCRRGRQNLCVDLHYLNGAFSEYVLVPARFVAKNTYRKPPSLDPAVASLTEPLACVVHGMDACDLEVPSDVVVYGAGPIGLLFVGAMVAEGHRVVLADPNPARLAVGSRLGAAATVTIARGGEQSAAVVAEATEKSGFAVAIDATGQPSVWSDAIQSVQPGGVVNLFGGCAPGTTVQLDTHLVHYSELTLKGVYHHRPTTVARALQLLEENAFDARLLLSAERPLAELAEALRSMIRKEALKVVLRP